MVNNKSNYKKDHKRSSAEKFSQIYKYLLWIWLAIVISLSKFHEKGGFPQKVGDIYKKREIHRHFENFNICLELAKIIITG